MTTKLIGVDDADPELPAGVITASADRIRGVMPGIHVASHGAIGDGVTDDRVAVQAAITAAGAGGTVVFDTKSYLIPSTTTYHALLRPMTGQTWVGNGASITSTTANVGPQLLNVDQVNNVTISGFTFTCPNVTDAVGIQLSRCTNVAIRGNTFLDPRSGGVHGKGDVNQMKITDNTFRGVGRGVLMNNPAITEVVGSSDWLIANNICDGLGLVGDGIMLNRPDAAASGVVVADNVVRNYSKAGSGPGGFENVSFGICLANITKATVTGNIVSGCQRNGIHLEDRCEYVTVAGNTVSGCHHGGIEVQIDSNWIIQNIVITGNTVTGCCTTPTFGLGLGGIDIVSVTGASPGSLKGSVISDNVSTANAAAGIAGVNVVNSRVSGNICNNNGAPGIKLTSPLSSLIIGNLCTDTRSSGKTQTYGMTLIGTGSGAYIGPNVLTGNLTGESNLAAFDQINAVERVLAGNGLQYGNSLTKLGFYGATPILRATVPAAATDPATTMALANALRTALVNLGLVV